jgi:hypothetical protein
LAVPAIATVAAEPDPIFAAIEKTRALETANHARSRLDEELEGRGMLVRAPGDHRSAELAALVNETVANRLVLAQTVPTTFAGLHAFLEYVLSESELLTGELYPVVYFDGEEEILPFIRSITECVRTLTLTKQ